MPGTPTQLPPWRSSQSSAALFGRSRPMYGETSYYRLRSYKVSASHGSRTKSLSRILLPDPVYTPSTYVSDGCHESNRTCHDRAVLGDVNHPAGISGGLAIKSSHPSRLSRAVHQHPEPHRNSARHTPLCPGTPPQLGVSPHKWGTAPTAGPRSGGMGCLRPALSSCPPTCALLPSSTNPLQSTT